jgi:hypothetical protein
MHAATCLKNVHVTSDIREHVTQWSFLDKKKMGLFREVHGFILIGDQLLGFWIGISTGRVD